MISIGAGDCGFWAQDYPTSNNISQPALQLMMLFDQVLANLRSSWVCNFLVGP